MNIVFSMNRPRFSTPWQSVTAAAAMAAALFSVSAARAAEPVLVQGSSIAITGADLTIDLGLSAGK